MIRSNKFLSNFGIIVILLCALSCDKVTELPIADKTPPQAVIIYPVDGISVAGDITVLARATDNEEVDSVQFYINQKWVGTDNSGENDKISNLLVCKKKPCFGLAFNFKELYKSKTRRRPTEERRN